LTHQICSFILLPSKSIVRILKSIPKKSNEYIWQLKEFRNSEIDTKINYNDTTTAMYHNSQSTSFPKKANDICTLKCE